MSKDNRNNCLLCKYFHRDETEKPCCECKLNSGFVNRGICNACKYKDSNFTQDYPCDICDDRNSSFSYSDRCDLEIKGVREMDLQEKLNYIGIISEMILNYAKDYPDVESFMLKNKTVYTDKSTGLSVEIKQGTKVMAKTSPSNFPRTKKSMNKLKNNIGFTVLTAYKLFRVCKDEKEVTILCWIVGKIINRINLITEKYGFEKLEIYRVDREE